MQKTIYALGILLLPASACKKNDNNNATDPAKKTTTTDSTMAGMVGNWMVQNAYTAGLTTGYFHQGDSTEITFYDSSYVVINATYEPTLHSFNIGHDTIFNTDPIFFNNVSDLNYMGIKFSVTGDTMTLYNFLASDTLTLLKIK